MQTADFTGFLRTVLIVIAIYYILKFLSRIFLPILMQKAMNKAQENFKQQAEKFSQQQQQYNHSQQNSQSTSEKEMPKVKKQVGEYIDYEEID